MATPQQAQFSAAIFRSLVAACDPIPPMPKPQKPIETLVTPLVGWRVFHMTEDGSRLFSLNSTDVEWEPRKRLVAECKAGGYGRPSVANPAGIVLHKMDKPVHPECTCGAWAYKTPDELLDRIGEFYGYAGPHKPALQHVNGQTFSTGYEPDPPTVKVLGEVYLWGRVCVHELGYRAEFACVKELHRVLKFDPSLYFSGVLIDAPEIHPEIKAKWRTTTWHTSENLTTKLESSLSGLLTSNQEKVKNPFDILKRPYQNANPLAYPNPFAGSSIRLFSYASMPAPTPSFLSVVNPCSDRDDQGYYCSLAKGHTGDHEAKDTSGVTVQTWSTALVPVNRSVPQAQAAQVAHKQTVAKSKFWQTISGLRAWQK